jgi:CheY-like chemotaxis protein
MPVISGIEFYEYQEQKYPELTSRVLFTTGDSFNSKTAAFLERVDRPVLSKPFTPDQLIRAIKKIIRPEDGCYDRVIFSSR